MENLSATRADAVSVDQAGTLSGGALTPREQWDAAELATEEMMADGPMSASTLHRTS